MSEMSERVKHAAKEEVDRIKTLTTEAVQSKAYLYPLKGVVYFISHKPLWRPLVSKFTPTLSLGVAITTLMFVVAYLPQAAAMAFTSGPLATISAAFLTLSESSTLTNLLSRTFLLEDAIVDTFDGTLLSRECTNLLSDGRQIKAGGDPIARLGKLLKKPFAKFTPNALIRYLLYLPLNFIPVVGTVIFIVLQGKRNGPGAHTRYFQLKAWSRSQRQAWIKQNSAAYTSFGVIAFLLEMIPIASLLFSFTNNVGAALWAADLEKDASTAPKLREQAEQAKKAE